VSAKPHLIAAPLPTDLDGLARRARDLDRAVTKHLGAALMDALDLGDVLIAAREHPDHGRHGNWQDWLVKEAGIHPRKANRYIHLAENRHVIEAHRDPARVAVLRQADPNRTRVSHLEMSITTALRLIREFEDAQNALAAGAGAKPEAEAAPKKASPKTKTAADLVAVWYLLSPAEQSRALAEIGTADLGKAIPTSWGLALLPYRPTAMSAPTAVGQSNDADDEVSAAQPKPARLH
jgi:hypothetical protein